MKRLGVVVIAVLLLLSFVSNASATNGYFTHGYSIKNKALAGAGVALPLDSLSASMNPAGMVSVGSRLDFGLSVFNPNREYTVKGNPSGFPYFGLNPGTVESDSQWFVIPAFGFNKMLNDTSSLGVSIFGNGGMNTDYNTSTFHGSSPTGVDLMQLFITPTYAIKLHPKHAVGISPILAYQSFQAKGLDAFQGFSTNPSNLTDKGHDKSFGYGARIGYLGEVLQNLFLGASYQTRIFMSKFNEYKGLFAEHGDFDIPSTWTVGLAYKATPALTFAADVQTIYYSEVDSIANPLNARKLMQGKTPLGAYNGAGFGWDDMTVFKFGVQWQSSKDWIWRGGFSYGEQPIPDSQVLFNTLAPGVIETHATLGVTKKIGDNHELDFAIMRAFEKDVKGPNPMDPQQTIKLKMDQWEFSVGYTYKF
jgi:long-chain fatty acid transport protein